LFVSFFLTSTLRGQNELNFTHLGLEEGFSINRANTIIQDQKGFIWVGTWNGLNRYDGYSCKTYQPDFHDSTTISNREIVELMEDSFGNIWIGTSNGLNCINPETGKLKIYEIRNRILSLCEDKDHIIWIGTWNGGLLKLKPSTGEITHYLSNDIVSDIHLDSRNILWVGTYYGLLQFNPQNGQYKRYLANSNVNSISSSTITQITESQDGKLWVGTWGGGLNRIDVQNDGQKLIFTNFTKNSSHGALQTNVISKLFYDKFNNLWIGTWNQGLQLLKQDQQNLNPEETVLLNYNSEPDNLSSFSGNGVSAIFVDRAGVLWVGGSTIDTTPIVESGANRYRLQPNSTLSESGIEIRALASYKNQLWIASNVDLIQYELVDHVYRFRKQYGRISFNIGNHHYQSNSILELDADSTGLWVGTEDAGLIFYPYVSDHLLNTKTEHFFTQTTPARVPGNKITSVEISKKYPGVVWVGTMQSGFSKLAFNQKDLPSSQEYHSGDRIDNYSDNNIRCIKEDKNGIVWIGTQNGLNRFDPKTNQFEQFFFSRSHTNSINDNVINAISEDKLGNLWIGTNSGLNRKIELESPSGEIKIAFKGYPNLEYLKNEIVNGIIEDQSQNLWIRMFRGFIKFDIQKETILAEYFSKDFENIRFERNITINGNDREIIIANATGFLTFSPDSILKTSFPPKVVITDFQIFNESIANREEKHWKNDLEVTIPYAEKVNVSYKDKMLTFVFSAMDFKNPKKNEYLFRLEGFDHDWNEVGNRNSATYTNIPHGEYIFKVKAKSGDGFLSEEETQLALIVSPPWWKTIWAYLFYIAAITGLLYFFSKYTFIKAQEKSNLKFEKLKTDELARLNEMKSFFFTDITHELKTPLTLILGPARELSSDKSLNAYASKQAELIKNSAYKLLRLVNQLMEFRKIEKGVDDKLFAQRCDINRMLTDVCSFFKPMADSRRINFSLSTDESPIIAYVDPDKIEKVIFNLISNAFKYSGDNNKISVSAELNSNDDGSQTLVIEVEDNGIGIAPEHQEKIFDRFYQVNQIRTQSTGGIGLFMAKALVEQHGGTISLKSEPGKGSCFKIEIPVNPDLVKDTPQNEPIPQALTIDNEEAPAESEGRSAENAAVESKTGQRLILVIEDDADLNDFLVSGLSSEFKVVTAFNGKEGLEKVRELLPDLILTDIMMPEMDGFEFCRITRKDINLSHIPVVFLTAKTMQEDEIKGLKLGAVDYIYKPFNLISLKLKINNILSTQKQVQDRLRTEQILQPETMELSSLDEIFLKDAVESVNKNLDNPNFDIEAFSSDLGASTNQVYRKIKALTGQTANEFIRNQRLKVAAGLLVQKKRTISEVIYMVGFNSPSYFSRCFKEFYGCTPKEYVERNQEGN